MYAGLPEVLGRGGVFQQPDSVIAGQLWLISDTEPIFFQSKSKTHVC